MRDPFEGIEMESETSASHELEFSNRVAGNLEHKSGLLAAIMSVDEDLYPDGPAEECAEPGASDPKVIPFPTRPGRR